MTRTVAALDLGGTGSVLAIWSLIVVVIGTALFSYSIVVTIRGRRRRRRRRPAPAQAQAHAMRQPQPPPPASRPLALPAGPTAGGVPVARHVGVPRARELPASTSRPLALPAGPRGQRPAPPPPARHPAGPFAPVFPPPAALPAGPVAGPPAGATTALPTGPIAGSGYPVAPPTVPDYDPAVSAPPAISSTPHSGVTSYAATSTSFAASGTTYAAGSGAPTTYGTPSEDALGGTVHVPAPREPVRSEAPRAEPPRPEPPRKERPQRQSKAAAECAQLRSECQQLRAIAEAAATAAAQAASDATTAHTDFLAAQRAADEARRALQAIVQEAADISAQIATLERTTPHNEKLQQETSHAAFAAYRRGDITSEQLREVFKRNEGWTPEHDRLSKRVAELKAEEADVTRLRDSAVLAEETAGERARLTAVSARALDDEARTAAGDARGRCAAADACEQRLRRR